MDKRGNRKQLTGIVVTDKMDKTARVMVERLDKHKKYKKFIKYRKQYLVHDPHNSCEVGSKVRIIESRPISKLKRWRVLKVLD